MKESMSSGLLGNDISTNAAIIALFRISRQKPKLFTCGQLDNQNIMM
jgi:hypothetical protein